MESTFTQEQLDDISDQIELVPPTSDQEILNQIEIQERERSPRQVHRSWFKRTLDLSRKLGRSPLLRRARFSVLTGTTGTGLLGYAGYESLNEETRSSISYTLRETYKNFAQGKDLLVQELGESHPLVEGVKVAGSKIGEFVRATGDIMSTSAEYGSKIVEKLPDFQIPQIVIDAAEFVLQNEVVQKMMEVTTEHPYEVAGVSLLATGVIYAGKTTVDSYRAVRNGFRALRGNPAQEQGAQS